MRYLSLLLVLATAACAPAMRSAEPTDPDSTATPERPAIAAVADAAVRGRAEYARSERAPTALPAVTREFRGVWVATVANIDWPSRAGLPVEVQQRELLTILDRARDLGLNAVIFQVRPAADALYPSPHEPWSEYLTGQQGRAPSPMWDPLEFVTREAHRRGLELHAWFNPFRSRHSSGKSAPAASHVSRAEPSLVRPYGSMQWMDPGAPAVHEQSMRVILDVVRRYDIDGVHIDDYFYPYQERDARGRLIPFPDDVTYAAYRRTGGTLARDDWRRNNVDRFVERMYREVKAEKAWVKVGVSPFGIWRPGYPAGVQGLDAYTALYADARRWLREGWLDYVSPQLYWAMGRPAQDYRGLLKWWVAENRQGRHVWPGNFTSRVTEGRMAEWTPREIGAQVAATRAQPGADGNIHFSMKAFLVDGKGLNAVVRQLYDGAALTPSFPWLSTGPPPRPAANVEVGDSEVGEVQVRFAIAPQAGPSGRRSVDALTPGVASRLMDGAAPTTVSSWVVRARYGRQWTIRVLPGTERELSLLRPLGVQPFPDIVAVSAVDRNGIESPADVHLLTGDATSGGGSR